MRRLWAAVLSAAACARERLARLWPLATAPLRRLWSVARGAGRQAKRALAGAVAAVAPLWRATPDLLHKVVSEAGRGLRWLGHNIAIPFVFAFSGAKALAGWLARPFVAAAQAVRRGRQRLAQGWQRARARMSAARARLAMTRRRLAARVLRHGDPHA